MNPRGYRVLICLSAAAVLLAGCREVPVQVLESLAAPSPTDAPITSDSAEYAIRRTDTGFDVRVGLTYRNSHATAVELWACQAEFTQRLERWNGRAWETLFVPLAFSCKAWATVSPAMELSQLQHYAGGSPATPFKPTWGASDPSGSYRAVWSVRQGGIELPLEQRISNTFRLRLIN